jgi:hypothetical protein
MSHHETRITEVHNPGVLVNFSGPRGIAATAVTIGVAAFAVQYALNSQLALASYMQGFFYVLCLGLGGAFFIAVNNVTKSVWSQPFRRIAEGLTAILPWTLLLVLPIILFYSRIYEWADTEHNHLHGSKATYLSVGFWSLRILAFLLIWNMFTSTFRNESIHQDQHRQSLNHLGKSARYLIVFGFTFVIFSVDLLMSLRPHWFSTMYGIYCFAGMFQSALCVMVLVALYLDQQGYLNGIMKKRHLFDLGTWLLAWCTFVAYIGFSQFMLIWYANLPEETPFFLDHLYEQWGCVYIAVFLLKWAIPFFVLMPKPCRTNPMVLGIMATAILLAQWLDLYWLITPEFIRDSEFKGVAFGPHLILSFLVGMGFLGFFTMVLLKFFNKNNVVAIGEPKLLSSINGDYL